MKHIDFSDLGLVRRILVLAACALMFFLAFTQSVKSELHCELTNEALESMPDATVKFEYADGSSKSFVVRLANNSVTRAAGFQRVCESGIAEKPILFVFERAVQPSFHMNNVVAGIDIAFIDGEGRLDSIHKMLPYVLGSVNKPRYKSKGLIQGALETYPGFFREHEVDETVKISWQFDGE